MPLLEAHLSAFHVFESPEDCDMTLSQDPVLPVETREDIPLSYDDPLMNVD